MTFSPSQSNVDIHYKNLEILKANELYFYETAKFMHSVFNTGEKGSTVPSSECPVKNRVKITRGYPQVIPVPELTRTRLYLGRVP